MISIDEARQRVACDFLALARRDAAAMRTLSQASDMDFAPIGFHAQQCIGLITLAGTDVPLGLNVLSDFTLYAVTTRYDIEQDDLIDRAQSESAVALMPTWATHTINPQ
jgi:hypothetical protein